MVAMLVRPGAPCLGLSIRWMLYLTAAASSGSPLWNLIPRRSLNCQVVSLSRRQDSARLPSSLSVLRSRRRSVSKICRSGSWAFLSQCMCQSSVAASPDCTTITGLGCAGAAPAARTTSASAPSVIRLMVDVLLEPVHGPSCLQIRIERIPQGVADQVDRHDRGEERHAGRQGQPVARVDELPALGEHAAPRRNAERYAEPEKAQARLGGNGPGHAEGGHHDQ